MGVAQQAVDIGLTQPATGGETAQGCEQRGQEREGSKAMENISVNDRSQNFAVPRNRVNKRSLMYPSTAAVPGSTGSQGFATVAGPPKEAVCPHPRRTETADPPRADERRAPPDGSGRGFGSLSLREVTRAAGIVPAGFYRHFSDMDQLGLALVAEVDETFRATLRAVRRNEFELGGLIDASVRIFLDAVGANRSQFLFLAREQYGGSLPIRQAIASLRQRITDDLAADLALLNKMPHLDGAASTCSPTWW